ncbi:hypothetical protein FI667_g10566, partial [Globisporangium splendens]
MHAEGATGIPPHLAIAAKLQRLHEAVTTTRSDLNAYEHHLSLELPSSIASKVTGELRHDFTIDGVAPITVKDVDTRIASLRTDLICEIRDSLKHSQSDLTAPKPLVQTTADPWRVWHWNDGHIIHFTPPGWEFSARMPVKTMWDL